MHVEQHADISGGKTYFNNRQLQRQRLGQLSRALEAALETETGRREGGGREGAVGEKQGETEGERG